MGGLVSQLPLLLPVLLGSLVLGAVVARPLSRRIGSSVAIAFLLVASVGLIVAVTLTPHVEPALGEPRSGGWCDMTRIGLPPLGALMRPNEASLNVLLFVPLGLAIGLVPAGRARVVLIVGGLAAPFVVELVQSLVTALGRGCQSADIFDNLTGLVVGLVVGMGVGWLRRGLDHGTGAGDI
jgi:hypothetical protein